MENKTSKLALFNSVKGNYSQKGFQPEMEFSEVKAVIRAKATAEKIERKAEFEKRPMPTAKVVDNSVHYTSKDTNFIMELPIEILEKFPSKKETLTKAQLRERRRAEVRFNIKGR